MEVRREGKGPVLAAVPEGRCVTMAEAARLAGVSRGALRRRIRRGTLPLVRTVEHGQVVQAIPLAALRAVYPVIGSAGEPAAPRAASSPSSAEEIERLRARAAALAARLAEKGRELERTRAERDAALAEVRRLAHELNMDREPAVEALAGRVRGDLGEARQLLAEAGAVLLALRESD